MQSHPGCRDGEYHETSEWKEESRHNGKWRISGYFVEHESISYGIQERV